MGHELVIHHHLSMNFDYSWKSNQIGLPGYRGVLRNVKCCRITEVYENKLSFLISNVASNITSRLLLLLGVMGSWLG